MSRLLLDPRAAVISVCVFALVAPSSLDAQTTTGLPDPSLWDNSTVYVLDSVGAESVGMVRKTTADSLFLLLDDGSERAYSALEIQRIDRRGDSLWNGFFIGAGLATLGALKCEDPSCFMTGVLGIPVAGLIGVAFDAMVPGRTTVYRAPSKTGAFTTRRFAGLYPGTIEVSFSAR
jgi:hypothetical protein